MTPDSVRAIDAVARQSLHKFLIRMFPILHPGQLLEEAPYLEAICHELERVTNGERKRLLIAAPPRHLKSIFVSVFYPAWLLGRNPSERIVVVSYSEDLARVHGQQCQAVMKDPKYRAIFPWISLRRATEMDIQTTDRGYRRAISASGSITGIGADTLILDDPTKADDVNSPVLRERGRRLVSETLMSRLNNARDGRIIFTQQRLHEDDLVAHVLDTDDYHQLVLPVKATKAQDLPLSGNRIWHRATGEFLLPTRFGEEEFQATRLRLGEAAFEAQYQQEPVPRGGGVIDWRRIQFHDQTLEPCDQYYWKVQSWDCAFGTNEGNSYSVCTTWAYDAENDSWLLVDLWRGRLAFDDLKRRAFELMNWWRPAEIYIEEASAGIPLWQEFWKTGLRLAKRGLPQSSKEDRVARNIHLLYEGRAQLPSDAPWLDDLSHELRAFPAGKYNDQVDSITQFLELLRVEYTDGVLRRDPFTREIMQKRWRDRMDYVRARRNPIWRP